jgi:hypothetical protein
MTTNPMGGLLASNKVKKGAPNGAFFMKIKIYTKVQFCIQYWFCDYL